jgi:hypothetical protein
MGGSKDLNWCCSNCNPALAELASLPPPPKTRKKRNTDKDKKAIYILMKAQCAEQVIKKYPGIKFTPDWRMWISNDDFERICDKTSLSLTVGELGCRLAKWKWGTEELEYLWAALLQAREALRDVQTTAQMRERIPNWPWHRVDVTEFKTAIKEDDEDEENDCAEGVEPTSKGMKKSAQTKQSKRQQKPQRQPPPAQTALPLKSGS